MTPTHRTSFAVDATRLVSGLWMRPADARAAYVFAHGAGAGMDHPFMTRVAEGLARRGIATLRYQFPFMEQGAKRTDPPAVAQQTVRAAVQHAVDRCEGLPLLAGGKSFGGRMTSQAEATQAMPEVRGLLFLGFPLHPAGKPATDRARHLTSVSKPMLFLQGTRDALADPALMQTLARGLGPRARLVAIDAADHAFHVLVRSGRTDAAVMDEILEAAVAWIDELTRAT